MATKAIKATKRAVTKPILAWHFINGDKLRDGTTAPADGEWLEYNGNVKICESGLHASFDSFDALQFAPGETLCLVECDGIVDKHDDKFVCRRRRIIARMDATEMLRYFARMQALSAFDYLDVPDVVADYVMTGDESIRDAARAAAWDAARDAAWGAASAAAWGAASAAARAAARAAAWDAASAAAWDAARDAARKFFNQLVTECFSDFL